MLAIQRSLLGASGPTNFVHKVHVGFDPITGAFTVSHIILKKKSCLSHVLQKGLPDQWNALLKGSKITPEDAAKNPQAVLEALEFYTEQTRRDKSTYDANKDNSNVYRKNNTNKDSSQGGSWEEEKKMSNPKPSRSTPAPRHIREAPSRPVKPSAQQKEPALPKVDMDMVKGMDMDVQIMMEKLRLQQQVQD